MNNTTRHFEYKDDKSSKFWEIAQKGESVTVRYGKTGTTGQSQTKAFADSSAASKHAQKLIAEKLGKGYIEQGATILPVAAEPIPDAPTVQKKTPQPKTTKPANPARNPDASADRLAALLDKDDATNRLLARHLRASPELLEKLSHSSDEVTRQAVAGNANTPLQIYVRLGQQFPKEFLSNPALDLLLMVNPTLMDEVPEALLVRLLKQANCPQSLLAWAAGHDYEKVQLAVAMNAKAPEQALQRLRQSRHPGVLEAIQVKPDTYLEQDPEQAFEQAVRARLGSMKLDELEEAWSAKDIGLAQWSALPVSFRLVKATDRDALGRIARVLRDSNTAIEDFRTCVPDMEVWATHGDRVIARNPSTPAPALEVLARDSDEEVRRNVAENRSTPAPVLETLAMDSSAIVRLNVAENRSTPASVLETLARNSSEWVRRKVAWNCSTPASVLETLARDSSAWVRRNVANNSSTPAPALEVLARDIEELVRRYIAENRSTPASALEVLARDSKKEVRHYVAANPSTPAVALEVLARDSEEEVRRKVAANPSTPVSVLEVLARDSDEDVRYYVSRNPFTPALALEALVSFSGRVRLGVAENPSTLIPVLDALSKDSDICVRCIVAGNPSTPIPALEALSKDSHEDVRRGVAANPSTPEYLTGKLQKYLHKRIGGDLYIQVATNPNSPLTELIQLVSNKTVGVRQALATQAHRSPKIRQSLWKDASEQVRLAVASCPALTQEMLEELVLGTEREGDLAALLAHPNLSTKSLNYIADKLLRSPANASWWYQSELAKFSPRVRATVRAEKLLSCPSKDPNKTVLSKRKLAPLMALCAVIEPKRLVQVVGSTDWLVRAAVARNRGTPPNLLKKLSADGHPLVAALANRAQADAANDTNPQTGA